MDDYDLIILGSGTAACAAAERAVELGARVAMVERGAVGGTCINVGCMPSKYLLEIGDTLKYADRGLEGVKIRSSLDFRAMIRGKRRFVEQLRGEREEKILQELGIPLLSGHARFASARELDVDGRRMHAEKFIIATGSSPRVAPIEGIESVHILTNEGALELDRLPESMVVIGGRAIGLEFAQMFAHFGTAVVLLQRSPRILPEAEPFISDLLAAYLREEGIDIRTGVGVKHVRQEKDRIVVTAELDGRNEDFAAEELLVATGRRPNTGDLGLERVGVKVRSDGGILVDSHLKTTVPHIWAAGDVLGEPMLEPVAKKEGAIAAENAITMSGREMRLFDIPRAVYTAPEVASVGLTEAGAGERGIPVRCSILSMDRVPRAVLDRKTRGAIKIVTHAATDQILGVHILSSCAAEMIYGGALAVVRGLTIQDLVDTIPVYPTMAEAVWMVAHALQTEGDSVRSGSD